MLANMLANILANILRVSNCTNMLANMLVQFGQTFRHFATPEVLTDWLTIDFVITHARISVLYNYRNTILTFYLYPGLKGRNHFFWPNFQFWCQTNPENFKF